MDRTKSKGHIGFFYNEPQHCDYEFYTMDDGDIHMAPLSNVIDIDTGNRIGRFFLPARDIAEVQSIVAKNPCKTCEDTAPTTSLPDVQQALKAAIIKRAKFYDGFAAKNLVPLFKEPKP